MFGVLDKLNRGCKLLMALRASRVGFHSFGELTPRITAVHFMTRDAGDSLTWLAGAKAL
jgi:hypothetical protein